MTDRSSNYNDNSNHEKALRWLKKHSYRSKELVGKSGEQIQDDPQAHMDMVIAPIDEAYRRGEISLEEARLQIYHIAIESLQERIKEAEEEIDALLVWGRADSKDPKIIERQKKDVERMKREDPVIIKLEQRIDEYKNEMIDMEQELLYNSSDDDDRGERKS
jgi:hypothetical protein